MPIVDHATKFITCKLVFHGPAGAGKTTNLTYLHSALPAGEVGSFSTVANRRDRAMSFEYAPEELATVGAYRVRFQLHSVQGNATHDSIRSLLEGADGIAFIADSEIERLDANIESLRELHQVFADQSISARSLPFVFQYNKQDLPSTDILSAEELSAALNFRNAPEFSASAISGTGVVDTLRALGLEVLRRLGARDSLPRELAEASL